MSQTSSLTSLLILSVSFFVFGVFANGIAEVGGSSEAREVLVSQTIHEGGSWIVPTRNGVVASKPPLMHWIVASLGEIIGEVTIFLHRSVSTLSAFLILLLVSSFVSLGGGRVRVALLSIFFLATSLGFFRLASDARVDMLFALFVTYSTVIGVRPLLEELTYEKIAAKSFLSFFFILGLAFLTKGPLAVALTGGVVFVSYAFTFGVSRALALLLRPRIGWIVFLSLGPLWYLVGSVFGGNPFMERHIFENFSRFSGGGEVSRFSEEKVSGSDSIAFYLYGWIRGGAPWSLFFPFALYSFFKNSGAGNEKRARFKKIVLLWIVVGTALFTLASGKRNAYLLPLYPPMMIFIALWIDERIDLWSGKRWLAIADQREVFVKALVLFMVVAISLFIATGVSYENDTPWIIYLQRYFNENFVIILSGLVAITALLFVSMNKERLLETKWCFLGAAVIGMALVGNGIGVGIKAEYKGYHRFASLINREISKDESLTVIKPPYEEIFDPLLLYLGRPATIQPARSNIDMSLTDSYFLVKEGEEVRKDFLSDPLLRHRTLGDAKKGITERDLLFFGMSKK